MSGFIEGESRHQATLYPERLDDYVAEDSAVRVITVCLKSTVFQTLAMVMIGIWFSMAFTPAQFDTTATSGARQPNVVD